MHKITVRKILSCTLFVVYLTFIFVFGLYKYFFSLALIMLAISLFFKALTYKSDSSLYLAVLLMFYGTINIIFKIFSIEFTLYYYIYLLGIMFSSFFVYVFFRQNIHIKVVAITLFEVLLLVIFQFALITFTDFFVIQGIFILYVLYNIIKRAKINTRSV